MNWDEERVIQDAARELCPMGMEDAEAFRLGVIWQRDQLRTDEAIERLALFLLDDEGYDVTNGWPSNEQLGGGPTGDRDAELKDAWMNHTREAITALIGDN